MGRRKKKVIILENVKIHGLAEKGRGVGKDAEGRVVFVERVVPGDEVDVKVSKKKKSYLEGFPLKFHQKSDLRIEPFCKHFGVCGGCTLQNLAYEQQLAFKQDHVLQTLHRIGKVEAEEYLPILPAESIQYYRNKLEFTFSNKRWLTKEEIDTDVSNLEDVVGFHKRGAFDKILNIDHCHLQAEPSNKVRNDIKALAIEMGLSFHDVRAHEGMMRHILLRTTTLDQNMMIVSFFQDDQEAIKKLLDQVIEQNPQLTSVFYCINPKLNDFMLDLEMHHYYGDAWIEEKLRDVTFRIGPKSFFQTNTKQAVRLFEVVEKFAGLTGNENVYDLYTGIGSIALFLASQCAQVVGIEEVEAAIEDAKLNCDLNDIKNAIFYAGAVKNLMTEAFVLEHGVPDVLITDPPRAGMHSKVIELLRQMKVPKVVYVSCNPATQARDIQLLSDLYTLKKVQPVDMFPHTHHIECVALLTLK